MVQRNKKEIFMNAFTKKHKISNTNNFVNSQFILFRRKNWKISMETRQTWIAG